MLIRKLNNYLLRHCQAFFSSLGRLWRHPVANFLTIAVIGIALALPAGLYILLQNVKTISHRWDSTTQISLFLKSNISLDQAHMLVKQLQTDSDIQKVIYISPEQGLEQFEKESGFSDLLQQLHTNPLPGVITVLPSDNLNTPFSINQLVIRLKQLPQVDVARLDMEWIKKLYTMIDLAQRAVWALGILLALTVILIIGNTIRLSIQNARREIEVTKLVGATNAFIRRPFLYTGLLYGTIGAFIAYLLVNVLLIMLVGPIEKLAELYQSDYYLRGFSLFSTEILFIVGIVLGLLGSWLAVGRQLKEIEPE